MNNQQAGTKHAGCVHHDEQSRGDPSPPSSTLAVNGDGNSLVSGLTDVAAISEQCSPTVSGYGGHNQAVTTALREEQTILWVQYGPPFPAILLRPDLPTLPENERVATIVRQNASILGVKGFEVFVPVTPDLPDNYLYPPTIGLDASSCSDEAAYLIKRSELLDHDNNGDGRQRPQET